MEVILKEDVNKLGHRGDVVKVADGYGRNYLLPGKLAIEATANNKAVIEQMKGSSIRKLAKEKIDAISYRDVRLLQGFVAERGKIVPRRLTGVCTRHQRRVSLAIKQSRNIALLAFAARF